MLEFLLTFALFGVTVCSLPLICFASVVLLVSRTIWLRFISLLHPDVEFVRYATVRTLLDTHRNQGIISVILSVKGPPEPDAVKKHLQEVVRRKDKAGNLSFMRLRHCLVTRFGNYAWQNTGSFDIDQHLTVMPFTFKGRAVTEFNIQEYVSDVVSKYLPSNVPPWQIAIIPTAEDQHYILLKLHHLLLSEGINIGDLLPLIPPTRQASGSLITRSPLIEVFKKPRALPTLKGRLAADLSNRWNEFAAAHDPLERPELLKTHPTLPQYLAVALITLASTVKDIRRGFKVIENDVVSKAAYVFSCLGRETDKRQVTVKNLVLSVATSADPRRLVAAVLQVVPRVFLVTLPVGLFAEARALYGCWVLGCRPPPRTLVGVLSTYTPLLHQSASELVYVCSILFEAPKTIVQDILLQGDSPETVTLCGRKSVAWSDPVRMDALRKIAARAEVSETELMLCAVSKGLRQYFQQVEPRKPPPKELPITLRNISSSYVFAIGLNVKPEDAASGILCLNLPVCEGRLRDISGAFGAALERQGLSHLLTMLQTKFGVLTNFLPAAVLGVYLRYLSRKYAVGVAEITSRYPKVTQRTLWGQEVSSVVYLRPPQANTSISLCLNEYAEHVRLGVMCDSQLVPHHTHLVRRFPEYIQELEKTTTE